MKNVYNKYPANIDDKTEDELLKKCREKYHSKLEPYFENGNQLHEEMGFEIAMSILRDVIPNKDDTVTTVEDSEKQYRLIVRECVKCIYEDRYPFNFLHNIIDGTLDVDRLDYTARDPLASGMDIGVIDFNRIFTNMRIILGREIPKEMGTSKRSEDQQRFWSTAFFESDTEGAPFWIGQKESEIKEAYKDADKDLTNEEYVKFALPVKSLNTIEDYLLRRFNLYKTIILHHHVVKTDHLLEKSVELIIEDFLDVHRGELNCVNDYIASDISGLWFPLGDEITVDQREDALSQWNDSWLMTCLKQFYYRKMTTDSFDSLERVGSDDPLSETDSYKLEVYILNEARQKRNSVLQPYLEELVCNRKRYNSLIKRVDDFEIVDYAAREILKRSFSGKRVNASSVEQDAILTRMQYRWQADEHGFFLGFAERHLNDVLKRTKDHSTNAFRELVIKCTPQCLVEAPEDSFVCFKSIKTGIGAPVYFYTDETFENEGSPCKSLTEISKIKKVLDLENDSCPTFFLYVLRDKEIELSQHQLLTEFGTAIGKELVKELDPFFTKYDFSSPL